MNKYGLFGRYASLLALERTGKPQDLLDSVLQTDQTKVEMFGNNTQQHV